MQYTFRKDFKPLSINLPDSTICIVPRSNRLTLSSSNFEIEKTVKSLCLNITTKCTDTSSLSFLLIIDDITRPTPSDRILEKLIAGLVHIGIPDINIRILAATGTHRLMTQNEFAIKVGTSIAERIKLYQHDCRDLRSLRAIGYSKYGYPLLFNSQLFRPDTVKIAIGNVAPHPDIGWSGGSKLIYPGLAGYETIAGLHKEAGLSESVLLGDVYSPLRSEIDETVKHFKMLDLVINTVLYADGSIYRVISGEPLEAQKIATKVSEKVHCVVVPKIADAIIADAYPYDIDFWQATKSLIAASQVVKDGGTILLIADCFEGIGPHPELTQFLSLSLNRLKNLVNSATLNESVAKGVALQIKRIQQRVSIGLVSSIVDSKQANAMGFQLFSDVQAALMEWSALKTAQSIILLSNAGTAIPKLRIVKTSHKEMNI